MRFLVTGGAGFIGSHFTRSLLERRYPGYEAADVTVLDKLTYAGTRSNLMASHPRLTFVQGDICDNRLLSEVVPGHDVVVHFAAESHVDRSLQSAEVFLVTNVLGTHRLLEACWKTGVQRIIHVSTDEVYGSILDGSFTERSPLEPNSPYASSKAASDCVVRSHWRTHGLDVSITRCSNNYGPRQHPEKLIPRFVTRLLDGRQVGLHGDGSAVREWLHVEDHCRAIMLVLDKGQAGGIYNIGGGVELSNLDLTGRLLELCGADWDQVRYVPDRVVQDQRYSLRSTKIGDELGFEPIVDFDQGLAEVVQWYRDNRWWWSGLDIPDQRGNRIELQTLQAGALSTSAF